VTKIKSFLHYRQHLEKYAWITSKYNTDGLVEVSSFEANPSYNRERSLFTDDGSGSVYLMEAQCLTYEGELLATDEFAQVCAVFKCGLERFW
jgi:hypothetical protein